MANILSQNILKNFAVLFVTQTLSKAKTNIEETLALKKLKQMPPNKKYIYTPVELNINYIRKMHLEKDEIYLTQGAYGLSNYQNVYNPKYSNWYREMHFRRKYLQYLKRNNQQFNCFRTKAFDDHDNNPVKSNRYYTQKTHLYS